MLKFDIDDNNLANHMLEKVDNMESEIIIMLVEAAVVARDFMQLFLREKVGSGSEYINISVEDEEVMITYDESWASEAYSGVVAEAKEEAQKKMQDYIGGRLKDLGFTSI